MAATPPLRSDFVDQRPPRPSQLSADQYNLNAKMTNSMWSSARVFAQTDSPETTHPDYTGPAIWYVTDGSGNITDVRIRA